MRLRMFGAAAALIALTMQAAAHELRPAYLDLLETAPGKFAVLWKTPMQQDARLALTPEFGGVNTASEITTRVRGGAAIQEWSVLRPSLRGESIRIQGLESTMTDVLVRISFVDGSAWTQILTPRAPSATIPQSSRELTQPVPEKRPALPAALAAWAVVCLAGAVARTRAGGRWQRLVAGAAYSVGTVAAFFFVRSIAEFYWLV